MKNVKTTTPSVTMPAKDYLKEIEKIVQKKYDSSFFPKKSFPRNDWRILTDNGLMLSMIPKEFGGRDSHEELCDIIEVISKYNLPLGMYTMIITALFVRNITKYGCKELQEEVLPEFASRAVIGGFALTEPHCGSNLAKMSTTFEETATGYKIKGEKHWQAFSLTADWWLIAAKNVSNRKEFAYFAVKKNEGWECLEEYDAMGLKAIDYGASKIDAFVPKYRRLDIPSEGLIGAIDMLCASRLSMAAMASGFISKLYKEVKERAKDRQIGRGTLYDLGYVKYKLKLIHANKIITKSLFVHLKTKNDFRDNLINSFFDAQAIKVLATDKMLESALNYQQLCGGEGYRYNAPSNNAAFALLDARVYTIFDGTNDLLSQQIAEFCIEQSKEGDITDFLQHFDKTKKGVELIEADITFLNQNRTHEEKVMNGQIIARIFGLHCLNEAFNSEESKYFEYGDYKNAILFLNADIKKIIAEREVIQENCLSCI
ncbi:acyl-CoA dehydrogenase family protein [Tenacibaculum maritimum]|uniref:acyl-CoA dehydrogenase family protein n=1 Tax=Tenacibaculum maritimum TaxID=107401 RepID=UPI0012E49639|nr:acyl-CoA dehydrogenase family protein [Tenacibaculum maritimum]MCD9561661.1 acyl-CoA/acyl-ACP dehydrogenase [Tenacibaculum maritimum]MCD9566647.1 acyl-CoA/acyl-ACP dehydrogenase [Tenacibaculum maritimum]MCD9577797.1 acyl-CoA/acyl-ACP dehydrogenase [Tenacibaculum maritimum]MCD9597347.1 acyl-CoA/acyl-ACP dehydrogenase [Tenacibaculum maritimum]MCD9609582.1 acyl-CoA/acyl-ACP dehydrogenase [Tenacibaculum maritimum]